MMPSTDTLYLVNACMRRESQPVGSFAATKIIPKSFSKTSHSNVSSYGYHSVYDMACDVADIASFPEQYFLFRAT